MCIPIAKKNQGMNAHLLTIYTKLFVIREALKLSGLLYKKFIQPVIFVTRYQEIENLIEPIIQHVSVIAAAEATSYDQIYAERALISSMMSEDIKIAINMMPKNMEELDAVEKRKIGAKIVYVCSQMVYKKQNEIYSEILRRNSGSIPKAPIKQISKDLLSFNTAVLDDLKQVIPLQMLSYLFDVHYWINWMFIIAPSCFGNEEEYKEILVTHKALLASLSPRIANLYAKLLASNIDVKMTNVWPADVLPDDLKRIIISYDVMDGMHLCSNTFYQRLLDCKEIVE